MKSGKKTYRANTATYRCLFGAHAGLSILLALLAVGMVNYLSFRHYWRRDISRDSLYRLSGKTRSLLDSLNSRIDVVAFFSPEHRDYMDAKRLLQEYEYASPHIRVLWLDPARDLAQTSDLAARYGVHEENVMVFDNQGRTLHVPADTLADYDHTPRMKGQPSVRTAFRAEQAFSSAILAVTSKEKPTVYFLLGHGEGAPDDPDPRRGFSRIAREIENDYIDVKTFRFGETRAIPGDCDVLIMAGPRTEFSMTELGLVASYLEDSGRLMVMLDMRRETGLDLVLEHWGVLLGDDMVVDPTRTLTGRGDLFATAYYEHPITKNMAGITTVFYMPRSVRPLFTEEAPDKPSLAWLVASSADGWAETNLDDPNARFDIEEDIPGPVPIALAVEKGPVPGIDVHIRPTRIVVFGDSIFASNKGLVGGNVTLFMNALNWLLEREELIDIAPRSLERQRLLIPQNTRRLLLWLLCGGLPGVAALLGMAVWLRRRR